MLSDPIFELLPRPRLLDIVDQLVSESGWDHLHHEVAKLVVSECNTTALGKQTLVCIPLLQRNTHILSVRSRAWVVDLCIQLMLSQFGS